MGQVGDKRMKISELISLLQRHLEKRGDLDCYTNGEHGINDSEALRPDHISIGEADMVVDEDLVPEDQSKVICHIGGY